jgi:hypothetical protein
MFAHGPARVKHELLHVYMMRLRPRTALQQGTSCVSAHSLSSLPSRFKMTQTVAEADGRRTRHSWLSKFEELRAYAVTNGHAGPAKKDPLCRWVEFQRKLCKKGRLLDERKSMLKTVGFCFDAKKAWKIRCQVKRRQREVSERRQRELIALASSGRARLTRSRNKNQTRQQRENAAFLTEMGSAWGDNFELLKEYKTRHGHPHVIVNQRLGGRELGNWANKQRVAFRQGRLSSDRELLLDSIGFCFDGKLAFDLREQVLLLKAHSSTLLGFAQNLSTATSKQLEALTQRADEAAEAFEAN